MLNINSISNTQASFYNQTSKVDEASQKEIDKAEFNSFIQEVKGEFSDKDIKELVRLQNKGTALEESGDMQVADKIWSQFDAILEKYDALDDVNDISNTLQEDLDRAEFNSFIQEVQGEFSDKDIKELIRLQDEGTALEESGDINGATQIWNQFDAILEKYDSLGNDEEKDYKNMQEAQNIISANTIDLIFAQLSNLKEKTLDDNSFSELLGLDKDDLSKMTYKEMFEKLDSVSLNINENISKTMQKNSSISIFA